jgi:hypothetical protein
MAPPTLKQPIKWPRPFVHLYVYLGGAYSRFDLPKTWHLPFLLFPRRISRSGNNGAARELFLRASEGQNCNPTICGLAVCGAKRSVILRRTGTGTCKIEEARSWAD